MIIRKISSNIQNAHDIVEAMDMAQLSWQNIAQVNWEQFPYCPDVRFRIAYNEKALLLHYQVNENFTKAEVAEDNGAIWTDSCVECFINPGGKLLPKAEAEKSTDAGELAEAGEYYYNIEANAIGKLLIGCGKDRHDRVRADKEVRDKVLRWSSLGREPFGERPQPQPWELCLVVPFSCFFKHNIRSLDGAHIKANFYKCGDGLSVPHYLSWQPIHSEKPDFHRPEFFGEIQCKPNIQSKPDIQCQ